MPAIQRILIFLILLVLVTQPGANTFNAQATAVFPFTEKGGELAGMGDKVNELVFLQLSKHPNIALVDRSDLDKLENEAVLNLSGMVSAEQAILVGQLTGAKIIVSGSVFTLEGQAMLVAKVIGTETSRVFGVSVRGKAGDSLVTLAEMLSKQIADTITANSAQLLASPLSRDSRLATLKSQLAGSKKPSLSIAITEHHINSRSSDPAAEIEMTYISTESGFEVVEHNKQHKNSAMIEIIGEGFSELASRKGNIVGVKARLEVKAIERSSGRILAVDRQTELEVDLSEIIAAKKALQRASAKIALRLLPKLVSP